MAMIILKALMGGTLPPLMRTVGVEAPQVWASPVSVRWTQCWVAALLSRQQQVQLFRLADPVVEQAQGTALCNCAMP